MHSIEDSRGARLRVAPNFSASFRSRAQAEIADLINIDAGQHWVREANYDSITCFDGGESTPMETAPSKAQVQL
jgi:hypothetical protein